MMHLAERKDGLLLIRYQQPQNRVVANTSLTNEGCGIGFGTDAVVDTAESDVLDPFYHRSRSRSMFLTHHFTFPLAIGTFVGPSVIDVGIAAKQLAVVQYQDATNFNVHSIEGNSGQRIDSVFNHDCLRAQCSIAALQCTQIVRHVAEFLQHFGSPNAPVPGLQLRQKAIAHALQIFLAIISARTMAVDALGHSTALPSKIPSSVNKKGNAT
jgi:hypothetical protein